MPDKPPEGKLLVDWSSPDRVTFTAVAHDGSHITLTLDRADAQRIANGILGFVDLPPGTTVLHLLEPRGNA